MINAPVIFRTSWNLIKPMMNSRTASKVVFVTGDDSIGVELRDNLHMSNNVVPIKYGGAGGLLMPGFPEEQMEKLNVKNQEEGETKRVEEQEDTIGLKRVAFHIKC